MVGISFWDGPAQFRECLIFFICFPFLNIFFQNTSPQAAVEGLPPKDPKEAKEKAPKSKAAPKAKGKAKAKAKPKANRVPGGRQWTPPGGFGRKNYQVKDGNTMNENTLVTLVNLISQSIGATLIHLQEVGHSSLRSKLYFLIDIRKDRCITCGCA